MSFTWADTFKSISNVQLVELDKLRYTRRAMSILALEHSFAFQQHTRLQSLKT